MPDTMMPIAATLPPLSDAMTAADLAAHRDDLRCRLGERAHVSVAPDGWSGAARVSLYEDGMCRDGHTICAPTWPDAIERARAWIATRGVVRRDALIRRMALAIIDISDRDGLCCERALVRAGFSAVEVAQHGADACARADEMCGGKPFAIVPGVAP